MATLLSTIITNARFPLQETTPSWFTDAELLTYAQEACRDLWRSFVDLHQEHFMTVDATNVSLAAATATMSGVPTDVFRILLIQPRDTTTSGTSRQLRFLPQKYNSSYFRDGLASSSLDPTAGGTIYYAMASAGPPVAAPTIYVSRLVTSAVLLRLVYIPTLAASALTSASNNPIPGESDLAVKAFIVAQALARDREDRSPDPNWLAIYKTEKDAALQAAVPRQEQEQRFIGGIFDDEYEEW